MAIIIALVAAIAVTAQVIARRAVNASPSLRNLGDQRIGV